MADMSPSFWRHVLLLHKQAPGGRSWRLISAFFAVITCEWLTLWIYGRAGPLPYHPELTAGLVYSGIWGEYYSGMLPIVIDEEVHRDGRFVAADCSRS